MTKVPHLILHKGEDIKPSQTLPIYDKEFYKPYLVATWDSESKRNILQNFNTELEKQTMSRD